MLAIVIALVCISVVIIGFNQSDIIKKIKRLEKEVFENESKSNW